MCSNACLRLPGYNVLQSVIKGRPPNSFTKSATAFTYCGRIEARQPSSPKCILMATNLPFISIVSMPARRQSFCNFCKLFVPTGHRKSVKYTFAFSILFPPSKKKRYILFIIALRVSYKSTIVRESSSTSFGAICTLPIFNVAAMEQALSYSLFLDFAPHFLHVFLEDLMLVHGHLRIENIADCHVDKS